ncbi:MAG: hypothetical protein H8E66_17195 [Planctomycetes bacterium]|nr:hypothetical protein [Planctomycetota bacterium]
MTRNRRTFLKSIPASLAVGAGAVSLANQASETECLDYGLSFICNKASFNAVRFWVESRTTVIDEEAGTSQVFYQCGACKSEHTFAEEGLFIEDNYDFLPVLGGHDWLLFRRPCRISETYREVKADVWGEPVLKLRYGKGVTELSSFEDIRNATAEGRPIVAQTEIRNEETKLTAVIEYPVKTMNISLDNSVYQVDTGPIAYPDLSQRFDPPIECISLAFVAFNVAHFADFIIEQPTPVVLDEQELAQVYHYSKPFSLPARNRLLALALPT